MRRLVTALAVVTCGVAAVVTADTAIAPAPAIIDGGAPPSPLTLAVAAGRHWRLDTPHGAVHVWTPRGYHADGAGLIAYVHGYYADVDGAWRDYLLPEQFALSGVNAMFIACEAPAHNKEPVMWSSLSELFRTVQAGIGEPLPSGPVIAMGHSGAFRTMIPWLDDPRVDWVVMVDAAYARIDPFIDWVNASPAHHLYFVGDDTISWTEEMKRRLPETVEVDRFTFDAFPRDARAGRIVYVRSQFSHMTLVTGGIALPALIRAMPLETLPDSPWQVQLGDLPRPDAALDGGAPLDATSTVGTSAACAAATDGGCPAAAPPH
ncbi:MAG TPA: hypothetical protein VL463_07175 [Kofleriaceae bacterium]|nr:hypothetical protein [Kofleriaceae bacterium]